ncbi:MAG: hypothetical protein JWR70_2275 [Modestobacter sp.]|nr:hypothetical protein [Modestobacter sp.]
MAPIPESSQFSTKRDDRGQIIEAEGEAADGLHHRFTVNRAVDVDRLGYHFAFSHVNFFKGEQRYLHIRSIISPDAGKASLQMSSGKEKFGYVMGFDLEQGQAVVLTTTGSKNAVSLADTPLQSLRADFSLSPPQDSIRAGLDGLRFFGPVLEKEGARGRTSLLSAFERMGLDLNAPAIDVMQEIYRMRISHQDKHWWQSAGWAVAGAATAIICLTEGIICVIGAAVWGWDANEFSHMIDEAPEPPAAPQPPTSENDPPWAGVPVPPPENDIPPDASPDEVESMGWPVSVPEDYWVDPA